MNAPHRLTEAEIVELAEAAFESPLGRAGAEVQARHYLLGKMAGSADAAREAGEASMEAPDCGRGMALAQWDDLSEPEQEKLGQLAGRLAADLCFEAARHAVTAARTIGIDERDVTPDTVALLALTPAIWEARERREADRGGAT